MPDPDQPAHIYTVRIWLVTLDDGRAEWRGKVQDVLTGERHYFRDWPTLVEQLLVMLPPESGMSNGQSESSI